MCWYQYVSLGCFCLCCGACFWHFFYLIRLGKPKDLSKKSGNITKALVYSNTVAMMPNQKESAYLHLPTYIIGIVFHIGSFIALLLFILTFFDKIGFWFRTYSWIPACASSFLFASSLCGLFLFLKRLFSKKLRHLSNLDDYFSTGIVTLFQLFSLAILLPFVIELFANTVEVSFNYSNFAFYSILLPDYFNFATIYVYYITASLLFLYLPLGKLKHVVYFFATRYQLGFFYGWRNTWPPPNKNKENSDYNSKMSIKDKRN